VTDTDAEWERLALHLEIEQLPSARKAAEQWRNGIAAVATLLGLASIPTLVPVAKDMSVDQRHFFAVSVLAANIAVLSATALASLAAFPKLQKVENDVASLRKHYKTEVGRIRSRLIGAKICALTASVAFIAALAIGLFPQPSGCTGNQPVSTTPGENSTVVQKPTTGCIVVSEIQGVPSRLNRLAM